MKVLVTGAKGFIGKHMCVALKRSNIEYFEYDLGSSKDELKKYILESDYIIHLAGVNRPLTNEEFYDGNTNFTKELVDLVLELKKDTPIIMSSSIQAALDNDYGKSKKMAEDYLLNSGVPAYIFRLYNVYGKWCRPNYNSVVATFCYNIAHDLDVFIRDKDFVVKYNFVEDVVNEFLNIILSNKKEGSKDILSVSPIDECSLGKLSDLLHYFKKEVESDRHLPLIHNTFELNLFKTFLDYLSDDNVTFNFAKDDRGYFEELYKSKKYGQISDNVSYPGITKGGHYHTYKKEIFYVVVGKCTIRQRKIDSDEIESITVDQKDLHPVDIKVGYTHEITNVGDFNSHTLMWISEVYDPSTHDTYREPLEK